LFGDILSMLFALIGTVCVILLTYYASRWYAKRMGPIAGGKYIKVVDRLVVSKAGSILIIDIEGRQYLLGVSDQNIQILKELEETIPLFTGQDMTGDSWKHLLNGDSYKNLINSIKKRKGVD
jgi:flagellar protein FliO/FliZ